MQIEDIRARFRIRCGQDPIRELATDEWLERCEYPVGVSPRGGLYALEPVPAEALWLVGDTNFRSFLGRVVFIAYESDSVYEPEDKSLMRLRESEILDPLRHPLFPDDIRGLLIGDGPEDIEVVWFRLLGVRNGEVFGRLLNEPYEDWGIHEGDVLPIGFGNSDIGFIAAVQVDKLRR